MERYRKAELQQMAATFVKVNESVMKTAVTNPADLTELLTQCQESAILMGTYFETLEGGYPELVKLLEDYCENLYQISIHLADAEICRKLSKKVQKELTGLQSGIRQKLPEDRKEVLFLPYKASMWDSLESIWKAEKENPDCDAYVIPIPYYDKNPDGSFYKEHYEGNLYPNYVPITRYDAYDFESRRPDTIYIHNPYDNANYVTSVHPFFYAGNLRKYTEQLVYVPYFVLEETDPEDQEAIDKIKHFCFLPGVIYAHKVIVQSERMRQIYVNEYQKAARVLGLSGEHTDRRFLEKKILGLGSPKFDKLMNMRREELEIPKEWQKIIRKPDGNSKKIVFYNTTIAALLQHNEDQIRKIEQVFKTFYERRERIALLWRPHPLTESTLFSMRPQIWKEYQAVKEKYIDAGWGIYDDTPDIDRAVIVSDAYYGDPSSVVQMYQKTGKPVMIQNVEVETEL